MEDSPVELRYTPEFKRNLRQLARKYRRIRTDLNPLLDVLRQGQIPGDQIPGVTYEVFKARVRNSDSGKGKSGGYRVIIQRLEAEIIVLLTLYSKSEQDDIPVHEIRAIIEEREAEVEPLLDSSSFTPASHPGPETGEPQNDD
jgi:mRNA-degrading endonuclease RelE of RelBE toxin-antitoxin system